MKNNRKILSSVILLFFSAALLFAGGRQEDRASESVSTRSSLSGEDDWLIEQTGDHITFIDSYGKETRVEMPVETVVSQGMGSFFAAIRALKAEDMVLASNGYITMNEGFFPRMSKLPPISTTEAVDNEFIITLNPDFIHTAPFWGSLFSEAVTDEIPLVMLDFYTTRDYRILGALLGKEAEAEEYINWIKSYTDIIDERIAGLSSEEYRDVFIYYGGQYGQSAPPPYGTFGRDNKLRNSLVKRAGGTSLTESLDGDWITVDPEWIIEQNPPLIVRECYLVTNEMGYSVDDKAASKSLMNSIMTAQPAFESSDAVADNEVYMLYGDLITDSWFIGLVYLAKWFHPDLFKDLDPEEMHQEYITRFQSLDIDVRIQGSYTYSAKQLD